MRCDARLEPRALALIAHLRSAYARGTRVQDGATLKYGSSLLVLRREDDALAVREPDFGGDPFGATRDDLTLTLAIVDGQLDLLARATAPARATMFWETMLVTRGALGVRRVYLERRKRLGLRDSGWTLGPLDGDDADVETRGVDELFVARPALASALAFPEGWLLVFDGDRPHAILDPAGRQAWPALRASRTTSL